ncbi:MAG: TIGR03617 family F420-dependent LLM class oxidoreductase [Gammaproteobacteria bacterium]|nr:TIGR03617 family F420-dependent LLM class oxidoreductase [Gammaproteobacteria bacterium]
MKVDALLHHNLAAVPAQVAALEAAGFAGLQTVETGHDPFFPLLLAAEHSKALDLTTAIAVAFARNPMNMAAIGNDLNGYSGGRFILGLGSQIRAHIERRFSMPWSQPAARMREFIAAMQAIWANWYQGEPLNFRGEFYQHTLMTPVFTPKPSDAGPPRVFLAAVGPLMTQVAADLCEGMLVHPLTSVSYLRDHTLPVIEAGLKRRGLSRRDFELSHGMFVVSGATEEAFRDSRRAVRERIAFYSSTPAYRTVLESHGWGELQPELNLLSKQGRWVEMGELISDEMLDTFAVVGEPERIVPMIRERFAGLVDRVTLDFSFAPAEARPALIRQLAG